MPSNWKPSRGPHSTSVTRLGNVTSASLGCSASPQSTRYRGARRLRGSNDRRQRRGDRADGLSDLGLHDHALVPVDGRLDAVVIDAVLFGKNADDGEASARVGDIAAGNDLHRLAG